MSLLAQNRLLQLIFQRAKCGLECDYFSDEVAACDHLAPVSVELWFDPYLQADESATAIHRSYCKLCGYTYGWSGQPTRTGE